MSVPTVDRQMPISLERWPTKGDSNVSGGVEFITRTLASPWFSNRFMTDPDSFPTLNPQKSTAQQPVLVLLLIAITLLSSLPLVSVEVKLWAQPSLVGFIWGGMFLVGFGLASLGRQPTASLLVLPWCALLQTLAFRAITDLSIEESLVVGVALVGTGWLARRFDRRMLQATRDFDAPAKWQLPIMDFFVATTLIACLAKACIQMTSPPIMLVSILGTLLVGCSCCWAAYHWAWNDSQPVGLPLILVASLALIGLAVLVRVSPLTAIELAAWLLVGPLSVLAAQSFTVLAVFGVIRWQNRVLLASQSSAVVG